MAHKPNKQQRANNRRRKERASRQAAAAGLPSGPRRGLAGYEQLYEVTREGRVWSRRLRRFINNPESTSGSVQIGFSTNGRRVRMPVWRGVLQSWLTLADLQRLRAAIPPHALGNLAKLRTHQPAIRAVANQVLLPERFVFGFLLSPFMELSQSASSDLSTER